MATKLKASSALKLSSPWVSFAREIHALFNEDPEVKVEFDEDENEVKLFVENAKKAEALQELLPASKTFGNVVLKITIIPANKFGNSKLELFKAAFEGNPAVSDIIDGTNSEWGYNGSYIVFKKKVIQYFNDDLSDANRVRSTLYAEIAKEVFSTDADINFCTDIKDSEDLLDSPLGEWP